MSEMNGIADVAVLGGGPAGYVAALGAAQRGARVILVEKQRVGGTCLNVGCIPTKALATAANLLVHCRRASDFGLSVPQATVNLSALMAYKQTIVDQFVAGVEHLLRARRVSVIYGEAHLACPGFLTVLKGESNSEIPARHIILAPGKS